ncbi:MAG: alpha/beta fold hydrolase [Alphaproteobacteria bacterium]|nr:alpha/beta fold hydrolase [Alphaproteobacteria bacterium]
MLLMLLGSMMAMASERPVVVFVHGMFMTGDSWGAWEEDFQRRGYDTVAPSWPGRDRPPAELMRDPDPVLRELTLPDVVEVYREQLRALEGRRVVLVGHSMGGLVVQLLLQDGLAEAGVAIDPAPPHGVSSHQWSFLRSNLPVLAPTKAPIVPSLRWFRYAFAHTMPDEEVQQAYETWVVPESRRVGKGPTTKDATVDFERQRPPLLLIAGEEDHIIPASLVHKVADRYAKGPSVTELRSFPGRTHWIVAQEGWEEVADTVAGWLEQRLR